MKSLDEEIKVGDCTWSYVFYAFPYYYLHNLSGFMV